MIDARDVVSVYQRFQGEGIQFWLTGGWGIDALLQEQTRSHKDLDVIVLVDDVARMRELLSRDGYRLKELWPENRWTVDAHGSKVPTAFVVIDPKGREIDADAMRLDERGNGLPAWEAGGLVFDRADLSAEGAIGGLTVQCLSPEAQMSRHTGYDLPDQHVRDLELLRERFGVGFVSEHSRGRHSQS